MSSHAAVVAAACALHTTSGSEWAKSPSEGLELALTYTPQRSIVTGSDSGFWLQGGAADAALPIGRNLSIAINFAAGNAGHTTASGAGLTLAIMVAGPCYTYFLAPHQGRARPSIFLEGLFGAAHGFDSVFPGSTTSASSNSSFALLALACIIHERIANGVLGCTRLAKMLAVS